MSNVIYFLLIIISLSYGATYAVRNYALKKNIIDIPVARSSHSVPTPRGGGIAIVFSFLLVLPILALNKFINYSVMWALLGSGFGIALLGFLDDRGHIAARIRFTGHVIAALWVLFFLGGFSSISVFGMPINLGWYGNLFATFYIVWLLNLYNFMDGIDGLASIEAITVCLGGAILYFVIGEFNFAILPVLLSAAVFGFLLWNFPPAKIFMGDAGSGFLGIVIASLSLQAWSVAPQLLWAWIIMLGAFVVDATYTLLHRLLRKEKLYEAHRSHAYQYASRLFKSHKKVSITIGLINIFWLFPWAIVVANRVLDGALATIIAYIPLILLAYKFKAGAKEMPL